MQAGPNPAITGAAIGGALGADQATTADARSRAEKQSALDTAELRELERAEYQDETSVVPEPADPRAGDPVGLNDDIPGAIRRSSRGIRRAIASLLGRQ